MAREKLKALAPEVLRVCEACREEAHARTVLVLHRDGEVLARAGAYAFPDEALVVALCRSFGGTPTRIVDNLHTDVHAAVELWTDGVLLVTTFDARSSYGLVRLNLKKLAEALDGIRIEPGPAAPGGALSGEGGAPATAWAPRRRLSGEPDRDG